jgi:DNA helicase INO80
MVDRDDNETEPEPAPVKERAVVKKKASKKSLKSRASGIRDEAAPKASRRSSVKKESPVPRASAKRQANGQTKPEKTWSTEMERKIQKAENTIDRDTENLDPDEFDAMAYRERWHKRRKVVKDLESRLNHDRRAEFAKIAGRKLNKHAELGKRRYEDVAVFSRMMILHQR